MTSVASGSREATKEALFQKLRPGPGLSQDLVVANQRARLRRAMVELVAERGFRRVTVRALSRLAGVSTKTFYDCFSNVDTCFAATYAWILRDQVGRARTVAADGDARLRARIGAFFAELRSDPKAAELVLIESLSTGRVHADRSRMVNRVLERFIGDELAAATRPVRPPRLLLQGAADAALQVARSELVAGGSDGAPAFGEEFADWLLALRDERLSRLPIMAWVDAPKARTQPTRKASGLGDDRHFLLSAVLRLGMSHGYESLTVPAIRREAGVSRRSFDQHFDGVADCFLTAIGAKLRDVERRVESRAAHAASWETAVVRTMIELCAEFAADQAVARLCLVDILDPGRPGLQLRDRIVKRWACTLREAGPPPVQRGPLAAEASVAAALSIAGGEAVGGRGEGIRSAAPALAYPVLVPAIGAAAAVQAISDEMRRSAAGL